MRVLVSIIVACEFCDTQAQSKVARLAEVSTCTKSYSVYSVQVVLLYVQQQHYLIKKKCRNQLLNLYCKKFYDDSSFSSRALNT